MITKIATIFIKQANPYEDYDDVTVLSDSPKAQVAALAGVGATGGAVGGSAYGLRKYWRDQEAVENFLANESDSLSSLEKSHGKYIKDLKDARNRGSKLEKKLQPLAKQHEKLVYDLIPNSNAQKRLDFEADLRRVKAQEKIIKKLQESNKAAQDTILSHVTHDRALQQKYLKQQAEHLAQQEFLNSAKGTLKYIGKPAAVGAGLLGTGTLAYGLYNKLKHS